MSKYSYDFKLKVVKEYLEGSRGYRYSTDKYNIPSTTPIEIGINQFEQYGDRCLSVERHLKRSH